MNDTTVKDIRVAVDLILEPGSVAEVRILNTTKGTVSGYYNDFAALVHDVAERDGKAPAACVISGGRP